MTESAAVTPPLTILITGASGLIGSALTTLLQSKGHRVLKLSRRTHGPDTFVWNLDSGTVAIPPEISIDGVVHLAGENIGSGRWTTERKAAIRESRIRGTTVLVDALSRRGSLPKFFIGASAVGYYGDHGSQILDESSSAGAGFLADLSIAWERAADPLITKGVRCVHPRFGIVLSTKGGALATMLPPFRLGLGGPLGDGSQYVSWVSLQDACRALLFLIEHDTLTGAFNITAPEPVSNKSFAQALAHAVHRPSIIPVPRFAVRLAVGDLADEALFTSIRVVPTRLTEAGFTFHDLKIGPTLERIVKQEE